MTGFIVGITVITKSMFSHMLEIDRNLTYHFPVLRLTGWVCFFYHFKQYILSNNNTGFIGFIAFLCNPKLSGIRSCPEFSHFTLYSLIGNSYTFPMISLRKFVSINVLTLMLKIIGQCDIKHIMTLPTKIITLVLKVATYIQWLTMLFLKREDASQSSLIGVRSPWDERWLRNVLEF